MNRIVIRLPAVADPVREFFASLGFLRLAAWQADGAAAKGTRLALERLYPCATVPGWADSAERWYDVATELLANYTSLSIAVGFPIVITEMRADLMARR